MADRWQVHEGCVDAPDDGIGAPEGFEPTATWEPFAAVPQWLRSQPDGFVFNESCGVSVEYSVLWRRPLRRVD